MYKLTQASAMAALRDALRYSRASGEVPLDQFEIEGDDGGSELHPGLERALIHFLKSYGPLGYVVGLVAPRGRTADATVDLVAMDVELCELGAWFEEAQRCKHGSPEQLRVERAIVSQKDFAFREVLALPYSNTSTGSFGLRAFPQTLRAGLWIELLRIVQARLRFCRHCDLPFEQPGGRHRPFEYCETHRPERFRKERQRRDKKLAGDIVAQ
ncbi:MAG: hypothetical protein IH609_17705 [Dehalococcoidia bacterium]|nr:hypothetical protein [Dehalococcoidia bacterium]